jgi:prepilin-type N-terminal cleavage/methylation domain-containing protein
MKKKNIFKTAFTMIELVIVIIIMGVMAFTAYKALMASSDKTKIGSGLLKYEAGLIRENAVECKEHSVDSNYATLLSDDFLVLFPKAYAVKQISGNSGVNFISGFGLESNGSAYATDFDDAHEGIVTFRSQAMPDCYYYVSGAVSTGYHTYTIMLDCSFVHDKHIRALIETKFQSWIVKNYDKYTVITDAVFIDSSGYLYASGSNPDDGWGSVSDGLISATNMRR